MMALYFFSLISLNSLFFNYDKWFCYITALPSGCPEITAVMCVFVGTPVSTTNPPSSALPLSRLISSLKPNFHTRRIQSPVSLLIATSGSSTVRHYDILVFLMVSYGFLASSCLMFSRPRLCLLGILILGDDRRQKALRAAWRRSSNS